MSGGVGTGTTSEEESEQLRYLPNAPTWSPAAPPQTRYGDTRPDVCNQETGSAQASGEEATPEVPSQTRSGATSTLIYNRNVGATQPERNHSRATLTLLSDQETAEERDVGKDGADAGADEPKTDED